MPSVDYGVQQHGQLAAAMRAQNTQFLQSLKECWHADRRLNRVPLLAMIAAIAAMTLLWVFAPTSTRPTGERGLCEGQTWPYLDSACLSSPSKRGDQVRIITFDGPRSTEVQAPPPKSEPLDRLGPPPGSTKPDARRTP